MGWPTLRSSNLGRLRQEDQPCRVNLGPIVRVYLKNTKFVSRRRGGERIEGCFGRCVCINITKGQCCL